MYLYESRKGLVFNLWQEKNKNIYLIVGAVMYFRTVLCP